MTLIYGRTESDPETGEARTVRRVGRSAVFCRCQVKAIESRATRGNCPSCEGWGQYAGGRSCRRCDGTGSVAERAERYVIGRPIEETLCDWCGAPLYVGDTAIETGSGIYCSRACASKVAS